MIDRIVSLPSLQTQTIDSSARTIDRTGQNLRFDQVLQEKLGTGTLHFSAHASARLNQRNIELSAEDLQKLSGAVDQAAMKGGRDTLVSMNDVSYVVNVPNRTVITAIDRSETQVFTQIDSAVFVQ